MNTLVSLNIDLGIHKGKMKVAQNEKQKKLRGFSLYINIVNFEVLKITIFSLFEFLV